MTHQKKEKNKLYLTGSEVSQVSAQAAHQDGSVQRSLILM